MNDDFKLDGILLGIVGIFVAILIFLGIVTAVQKAFKNAPKEKTSNTSQIVDEQRKRAIEIENQRQRLMDSRRQQLRDHTR